MPSHQEISKVGEYACSVALLVSPPIDHGITALVLVRSTGSGNQIKLADIFGQFCKFLVVLSPCASYIGSMVEAHGEILKEVEN